MTPREPDRYTNAEWQRAARILDACLNGSHEHDEGGLVLAAESWRPIAAALRAAESSALERAARIARRYSHHAEREIRALIPLAAAPAEDSALESMCDCGRHVEGEKYALPAGGHVRAAHVDAPAAETGKAHAPDLLAALRIAYEMGYHDCERCRDRDLNRVARNPDFAELLAARVAPHRDPPAP